MENKNTILVVGQAKPSKEDAIYNLHGEFYISLIVERDTGKILELDCNTILEVTKQFVASMFVEEPEDRRSADREGDQGALFCFDAEAIDRVHEGCVQPVPHGDRGKPRKIIVQMRKQENRIFNIIKPEFSSGCFFLVFQETD